MAVAPRLDIRQSQQLVMTPQLQQAIKLLQLSNLELSDFVEQELEKNPLLERGDSDLNSDQALETVSDKDTGFGEEGQDSTALEDLHLGEQTALPETGDSPLDTDYDNTFSDSASDMSSEVPGAEGAYLNSTPSSGSYSGTEFSLENTLSDEISLQDHLSNQLALTSFSAPEKFVASFLIDQVTETGYLSGSLEDVAESLDCSLSLVENTLLKLQDFDPAGVFARDLAECLALQLKEKNRFDPAMEALLANLDKLAGGDLKGLMSLCGVDQEDMAEMISEIRELDPKPGLKYGSDVASTVIPDVFVSRNRDGSWHIELNSETLPKVLVNNRYHSHISNRKMDKQEKEYLSECLNSANWLVKALDQRAQTILKVATELVSQQELFFTQGIEFLRPMNLKAIADAIDMHESTVSRVTNNKYLATARGIFELKYFFTSAINSTAEGGVAHSAESVKHKLKQLVDEEAPSAILSDDKIVELMKHEGIDIARRTVAKYRDALNIPSSVERRRQKKLLTT